MKITVETFAAEPIEAVWHAWTTPADIKHWNAASDDSIRRPRLLNCKRGARFHFEWKRRAGAWVSTSLAYTRNSSRINGSRLPLVRAPQWWSLNQGKEARRSGNLSMPKAATPSSSSVTGGRRSSIALPDTRKQESNPRESNDPRSRGSPGRRTSEFLLPLVRHGPSHAARMGQNATPNHRASCTNCRPVQGSS